MRVCLTGVLLAVGLPAAAAQIVAMDVAATGGVPSRVAAALTPLVHSELSRIDGMSVVTQADVQAMVNLEATKISLGCTETNCLADLAGAFGAELLVTSSVGRVGSEYVLTLVLIQVDGARVLRRVSRRAKGGESEVANLVPGTTRELFKAGLPASVQGPGSMSWRGFRAALAGLRQVMLDPKRGGHANRRRIILDLVRTELDYDAKPKMRDLNLEISGGRSACNRAMLGSKDLKATGYWVSCVATYGAINDDLERVKEIRERARARGVVPSARPLRFERAESDSHPAGKAIERYVAAHRSALRGLTLALKAYGADKPMKFALYWDPDKRNNAQRVYESSKGSDRHHKQRWDVRPLYTFSPRRLSEDAASLANKKGKRITVYRRSWRNGKVYDVDRVRMRLIGKKWFIESW
jgi:hypothetical protein